MSKFTVTPVATTSTSAGQSPEQRSAQSSRERAMATLMGQGPNGGTGNAQTSAVQNQTQISPEETTNLNSLNPEEKQTDTQVEASSDSPKAPEEAPAPEATTPEKEEPLSSQYAVLARKEKALRAKETAFKQREAQLAAREAELSNTQPPSIDKSKYIAVDDLKRNAYGKLQELGLSYDDISAQALQAQSPEFQAMQQMRAEIDAKLQKLEDEQAKTSKTFEEQQSNAYKGALKQIEIEANQLVSTSPEFETIKEMGAVKDVVDLIERTYQEDGTLLTVEQAAAQVEDYLIEEALKLANMKKIQARLKTAVNPAKPAQQPATPAQQTQPMKTLTNAVGSSRQLSARERAILAAKGEKF